MINWDKPKKIHSTEEHNRTYSSDTEIPGTYVPNMSEEDQHSWKGKHINKGKANERVELRKTFSGEGYYAQVLIVIVDNGVKISSNGSIFMTHEETKETRDVINEAKQVMGIV